MKKFGTLLREFREKAGLSQYELSDLVKIHPSHISRLERGERKPRIRNLMRFINAFNLGEEDRRKLLYAAGYSAKLHEPLVFYSPSSGEELKLEFPEKKELSKLINPALKVVAEILSDPELPIELRKNIETIIILFAEWLRDKMKCENINKFSKIMK